MKGVQTKPDGLLSSSDVCQLTGLTYRQLDMWTRRGLIEPAVPASGSGTWRWWDPAVLFEIAELQVRIENCPFHPHQGMR